MTKLWWQPGSVTFYSAVIINPNNFPSGNVVANMPIIISIVALYFFLLAQSVFPETQVSICNCFRPGGGSRSAGFTHVRTGLWAGALAPYAGVARRTGAAVALPGARLTG